jgi:hypothetical protein
MNLRFSRRDIDVHFRRIYLEAGISDLASTRADRGIEKRLTLGNTMEKLPWVGKLYKGNRQLSLSFLNLPIDLTLVFPHTW